MMKLSFIVTSALALVPLGAWSAGGHYPVDDAEITAPGEIQVETWLTRRDRDNVEFAFLPAFTVLERLELTAGVYRIEEDGSGFTRFEPAAKLLLPGVGGDGLAVAVSFAAGIDDGRLEDWLLNAPVTAVVSESLSVHANVGWLRLRGAEERADRLFLGLGGEFEMAESLALIGQLYREGVDEQPEAQAGLRWAPATGALEHVDLALGRVLRGSDRDWFVTLGVAFTF